MEIDPHPAASWPADTQALVARLERLAASKEALRFDTLALRLCNGSGDGLPGLTVDRFNRHYLVQLFDARLRDRGEAIGEAVRKIFDPLFLVVKDRSNPDGSALQEVQTQVVVDTAGPITDIRENGLLFRVDLLAAANPGLFLDMRSNRLRVGSAAKGRRVLNCFAYTCSFGVYCRAHGARETTNVDISRKILDIGSENYALNGIVPSEREFVRADSLDYLELCCRKGRKFDSIILDPPSFSRHAGKVFSVRKDLAGLVGKALDALEPGGDLFVSTNCSALPVEALAPMLQPELTARGLKPESVERLGQDSDFTGSGGMRESVLSALWYRGLRTGH